MKKYFLIFALSLSFLMLPASVKADVINPDWFELHCAADQLQVECTYKSEQAFGPKIMDECEQYENNPEYVYLTGHGSSFGGEERYCLIHPNIATFVFEHLKNLFPFLFITVFVETSLFFLLKYRSVLKLTVVAISNILSLSLVYILTLFITDVKYVNIGIAVYELFVLLFEYTFIQFFLKENNRRALLLFVLFANVISTLLIGVKYLIY
ncbi:MAG: hypothetical protein GW762_04790 [Candidatus Pacebacteria bacterium]|nr:hypothetical protein [Candidatus Paceibacterota bacterium]PIZ78318.1 MAG: hypothetical protein COY01_06070 [Candidatus Pacebacteria bacterium CG_4_10_14_0_2_um_filter_40_20]PJA68638.1 MAG: hypothetical protein CO156_03975 [Candidatus Pacebacteria bacterium CG_4_9_14_3_um_filter_40_12]PJC41578.1 MAG: hypothetical protein CO041_02565 [Candidatus Pacebacteria bacterium CG_4_9_14_0_2_um_filter_40_15]